jgi:hypothetical protein
LAFHCFLIGLFALPLCGAALTFFAAAKKVSKESGSHRQLVVSHHGHETVVVRDKIVSRITRLSDKAFIHPARTLCARRLGSPSHRALDRWLLAVGCWLLAVGCWLLAVGCWLLAVGWWLVAGGWWLVAGGWWLVAGGWWLVAGGWWQVTVGTWWFGG